MVTGFSEEIVHYYLKETDLKFCLHDTAYSLHITD